VAAANLLLQLRQWAGFDLLLNEGVTPDGRLILNLQMAVQRNHPGVTSFCFG
jgi:hypothetical protein